MGREGRRVCRLGRSRVRSGAAKDARRAEFRALAELARTDTADNELRLVAWTNEELQGVRITPAANQARRGTVIVAHLTYGPARPVELDFNSRAQVAETIDKDDDSGVDFHQPAADNGP